MLFFCSIVMSYWLCFFSPDFSLVSWMDNYGIDSNGTLTLAQSDVLMANLGVSQYLSGNQCNLTNNYGTWNNGKY